MNHLVFHVESAKVWLRDSCTGEFSGFQLGKELGIDSVDVRNQVITDLLNLELIEPVGGKHGIFAPVKSDCPRIDWEAAKQKFYPIWMPFGLHRMVGLRPKNIVVIAGETNSGKSLLGLLTAHKNLAQNGGRHRSVHYFNSEMGPDELRDRLTSIDPAQGAWAGFEPYERNADFHSVIRPDGLNIVDYLEISEPFSQVVVKIQKIYARLNAGICFILLQKAKGKDTGRGGEFTLEKSRLGLALSHSHGVCSCKIVKCKCPLNGGANPEGQELDYRIQGGATVTPIPPGWRWVSEKERRDISMANEQAQIASRFSQKWAEYA